MLYRSLFALHTRGLLHAAVGDPATAISWATSMTAADSGEGG